MTVFAADPPSHRIVVTLDALAAVYHRPSGATHLLASPAPELLDALAEGPADAATLLDRLSARFDLGEGDDDDGGDGATIAARLDELASAGLVKRV